MIMRQIVQTATPADRRVRHDLAHTLKGSARAVGAAQVANAAQALEESLYEGANETDLASVLARLEAAVADARAAAIALAADK